MSDNVVTGRIIDVLNASGHPYERRNHSLSRTAEEAALVRGTALGIGGKSLVMKLGKKKDFAVFVVSGARRLDNWKVRQAVGVNKLRFATVEELFALTGLRPGCVPPFGRPVFDLPLYVDAVTAEQLRIAFTLADHRKSA
ncbi:MAG: prolyl-tRNA editing enzyme YbaK/EbsC (Cys-tRNA(Pro) deacylase), partial [bacterium]